MKRPGEKDETPFPGTARFAVVRRIGAGGMGVVYEVVDRERNTPVALKTLRHLTPDSLIRFKHEFRALQDLHHANLVSLGELFEHHGHWFFTMELVRGVDFMSYVRPSVASRDETATVSDAMVDEPATARERTRLSGSPARSSERVDALPASGGLDETRLRRTLPQLVRAVFALHQAGKVHRDLKPSNILVTSDGRLVVLDFGLIVDADGASSDDGKIIGTVGFMAPEQATGKRVGPAADWYSVGVLLYLALTGRLPFAGRPTDVIEFQSWLDPADVTALAPNAPPDLAALAMDLLRRAPAERPSGAEVLTRLRMPVTTPSAHSAFVGREHELALLGEAFERVCTGHRVALFLRGESGVGKTTLVQHFTDRLRANPDVVVLAGRCYERESVPYKAFDGILDELTQFMESLSSVETALLLPRAASLLRQTFPQLGRVACFADVVAPTMVHAEPHEQRLRVFAALRELLARLRDRRPLVLVIDDIQWADADSLALLAEILREPDAPPLLLLATVRTDLLPPAAEPATVLSFLSGDVRHVQMRGLGADDARQLATLLLGANDSDKTAVNIAAESQGHPLFIAELVRSAGGVRIETGKTPKLDDTLWDRVERLAPDRRSIVEAVAVAGSPLLQIAAARATALELGSFTQQVMELRAAHLVRTRGARASDLIEPYHDRVRNAVLRHLSPERTTFWHQKLAAALEASGAGDPEAIANHWRAAGDPGRAAAFAVRAAEQSTRALAFDRAARLYQLALELGGDGDRKALLVSLAESLANAGRGHAAALAYSAAAARSDAAEALDLRRLAAQHLLSAGYVDEGLEALSDVLGRIGMRVASTPRRALASLLWSRVRIRLRGLRFTERSPAQIPPAEVARVDTCYSVAQGLCLIDVIRGAEFQSRHLLLALDLGEPGRVARALAIEGSFAASQGARGGVRGEQLLRTSTRLADKSNDPLAQASVACAIGFAALQQGRWKQAREHLSRAEHILRERCTNGWWELAAAQAHLLFSLVLLGEFAELRARGARYVREAEERGDLFASTLTRLGPMTNAWLAEDNPDGGEADAVRALAQWSHREYHQQHFFGTTGLATYALYRGEPELGTAILDEDKAPLERSLLLQFQSNRLTVDYLRARCALAQRLEAPPSEKAALERVVRRHAHAIEKEHMAWSDPLVPSLRAGLASQAGKTNEAIRLLEIAERGFAAVDMPAYQLSARRWRGRLIGGEEGRALGDGADAELLARGCRSPLRTACLMLPGFAV